MSELDFRDFSGGLNVRDSVGLLQPNETPDAINITLDERGSMRLRNGCPSAVALPGGATGQPAYIHFSVALNLWICCRWDGSNFNLYSTATPLGSAGWTLNNILTTVPYAHIAMIDFPGTPPRLVISTTILPGYGALNGQIHTWDGATLTLATITRWGTALALWQNKVWVGGHTRNNADGNPTRLFFSDAGNPNVYGANSYVDVRELSAEPIRALGVAGGRLVVFKDRATYAVSDSTTGAYVTIDPSVGCVGQTALVHQGGLILAWGKEGLHAFDGIEAGQNIGDKVRPYFLVKPPLLYGDAYTPTTSMAPPAIVGGSLDEKSIFCFPDTNGLTRPNMLLEVEPDQKWLMRHQLPSPLLTQFTSFAREGNTLYGANRDNKIYKIFTDNPGGVDNGTPFRGRWRIPWTVLNRGKIARLRRAFAAGLCSGEMRIDLDTMFDFIPSNSDSRRLDELEVGVSTDESRIHREWWLGHGQVMGLNLNFYSNNEPAATPGNARLDALLVETTPLELG